VCLWPSEERGTACRERSVVVAYIAKGGPDKQGSSLERRVIVEERV